MYKLITKLHRPPISVGSGAVYPYIPSILESCERKAKYPDADGKFEFNLARVVGSEFNKRILVPRNMAPSIPEDTRVLGVDHDFISSFVPRNSEQERCISEVTNLLRLMNSFVFEAPTGFGKTWCAADIIAKIRKKTIIVVTKEDILDQWVFAFEKLLGLQVGKGKGIGIIKGDKVDTVNQGVVIAMVQSVAKEARYSEVIFRDFGLAIWDESGSPDTLVTTSVGQIRIQDLVRNKTQCKALSLNTSTGFYEWREILAYHEHPPKNPMMRVTHEQGYLDFTSEHLCFTDRGWVKVQDLLCTDFLTLDTGHSFYYNNSKHLENGNGGMATRNGPRGYFGTNWHDHEQGQIADSPRGSPNTAGHGEVSTTSALRPHAAKGGGEPRLGRTLLLLCNVATGLANALLASVLLTRRSQNPSAVTCNAAVAGMAGVVGNGRWFKPIRVHNLVPEQVSKEGCGGPSISAFKLRVKEFIEKSQGLLSRVFKRSESDPQAGTSPVHNSKHDVQAEWGPLRGKSSSVQGVQLGHSNAGWATANAGVLPERDLPEGQKVHELPPCVHSSIAGSQNKSLGMGVKVRVLSVAPIETPDLVYDIEVEGNHNFIANGIVVHNCHRIGADFFSQSCFRIPAMLRLGISATPDRKDGREEVIEAHIGPIRVRTTIAPMTPRVISQESPWKIPLKRKVGKDGKVVMDTSGNIKMEQMPHTAGRCGHIIRLLSNNHPRNKIIANFVSQSYKAGRKILVQSDRKDHLEVLASLIASSGVPIQKITYYVGGLTSAQREKAKEGAVLMATYQMTAEATDIPDLDTLVMATPKSDVRQIVGRILRLVEGKKEPVVFDLVDSSSSVFSGYAATRAKWYASVGAKVQHVKAVLTNP